MRSSTTNRKVGGSILGFSSVHAKYHVQDINPKLVRCIRRSVNACEYRETSYVEKAWIKVLLMNG